MSPFVNADFIAKPPGRTPDVNPDFIAKINSAQKSWTATYYPEYEDLVIDLGDDDDFDSSKSDIK